MEVFTPQVLWHGGGQTNGKTERVYSVDIHPIGILVTSGIDGSSPAKGCVRLMTMTDPSKDYSKIDEHDFLTEFTDHESDIHVARFSPNGLMLATGSDRRIVVYAVDEAQDWLNLTRENPQVRRQTLATTLTEIYDLQWAPTSKMFVAGSINGHAEYTDVSNLLNPRCKPLPIPHSNFVQGVAWDPLQHMVVTQSRDRSCRVYFFKRQKYMNRNVTIKTAPVNESSAVVVATTTTDTVETNIATTEEEVAVLKSTFDESVPTPCKGVNLFADDTVDNFFRRPSFSPDGAILVTPTGVHKVGDAKKSFATHIFIRSTLMGGDRPHPAISLKGLQEPSVAVRFSPRIYKLVEHKDNGGVDSGMHNKPLLDGSYRMVFAVATMSAVLVYDTQHMHPIAHCAGMHCANINDIAWSADGRMLVCASSDGYVSFIRFKEGVMGDELLLDDLTFPKAVKQQFPCIYPMDKQEEEEEEEEEENVNNEGREERTPVPMVEEAPESVLVGDENKRPLDTVEVNNVPVKKVKNRITPSLVQSNEVVKSVQVPVSDVKSAPVLSE